MKTWLFTWNPSKWAWDDPVYGYPEMVREVENYGFSFCKWTCGGTKSICPGDRIFLIRLGVEPRGIVASGTAITPVYEGTHWDEEKRAAGIKAKRVYIRFDKILDYKKRILSMDLLKAISGTMRWSSQASGITIPDDIAEELEQVWKTF